MFGQGGGKTVYVKLFGVKPFRFYVDVMPCSFGKLFYLIFDRRAVAGAGTFYLSGKKGCRCKVVFDNFVCGLVCVCDVAFCIGSVNLGIGKRNGAHYLIGFLFFR